MSTLNTILSDEDTSDEDVVTEEVTEDPVEEPEPQEPPQEEPEPEPVEEPAAEEPKEPSMVPLAALQEERQKRQELDDRLAKLEGDKAPPEPEPVPDMLEDPEGYQRWVSNTVRTAQLNAFEESARDVHGDDVVESAYKAFEAIKGTPEAAAIIAARNPWRSMVKWHKDRQEAAKVNSEEWRASEREKIRSELLAELRPEKAAPPPPPSLAKAANLGNRTEREIDESALSLDDILGNPTA